MSLKGNVKSEYEINGKLRHVVYNDFLEVARRADEAASNANECAELAYEAAEKANAVFVNAGNLSNALKKTVSGNAVRIGDSSTLEHEMKVRLKSKNFVDMNDLVAKGAATIAEDGSYYTSPIALYNNYGPESGGGKGGLYVPADGTIPIVISATVKSEDPSSTGNCFIIVIYYTDGTSDRIAWDGAGRVDGEAQWQSRTLKSAAGKTIKRVITAWSDIRAYVKDLQIEEGTTATAYTPYVDVNGATVKKYGKSLLSQDALYRANVFYKQDDGRWFYGKVNGSYVSTEAKLTIPANTNFTCSFEGVDVSNAPTTSNGDFVQLQVFFTDGTSKYPGFPKSAIEANGKVSITYYPEKQVSGVRFSYPNVTKDGNYITFDSFRIELGTIATEHEDYKDPETITAEEDGTVNGIIGNGDTVTLVADNGVIITAEYNRDLNKAFAEIYQAIATMGAAAATIPEEV